MLNVREQEKQAAELDKKAAMETFENFATRLYNELSVKEKAEQAFETKSDRQMTIEKMKQQFSYISQMNQEVAALQKEVHLARTKMEMKQKVLTTAYREVKKMKKLIEIREKEQTARLQNEEDRLMDEISMQQFFKMNTN